MPTAAQPSSPATDQPSAKRVQVRLFGIARSLVGSSTLTVAVPTEPLLTVAELHRRIVAEHPGLANIGRVRYAIEEEFADEDDLVDDSLEIALLPPVSGG